MTKPGPKPKPTKIRIFEGNPGNIPLNPYEPEPIKLETLTPPKWMSKSCKYMVADDFPLEKVSKAIWDDLMPELKRLGVLTEIDRNKFARYCELFARWLKMKAFIDKHGEAYPIYSGHYEPLKDPVTGQELKREDGSVRHVFRKSLKSMNKFPQADLYRALSAELNRYEGEFGIGAASRTRITAVAESQLNGSDAPKEDDEFNYAARKQPLRAVK